jgi:hypothetical protein
LPGRLATWWRQTLSANITKMLYSGRPGSPVAELATEHLMFLTPLGCKSNAYHA